MVVSPSLYGIESSIRIVFVKKGGTEVVDREREAEEGEVWGRQ